MQSCRGCEAEKVMPEQTQRGRGALCTPKKAPVPKLYHSPSPAEIQARTEARPPSGLLKG
eukprot:7295630-Pyramimonas_sp.AAC.1